MKEKVGSTGGFHDLDVEAVDGADQAAQQNRRAPKCSSSAWISARFHKVRGHRDLNQLVQALQRHEIEQGVRTEEEAA
jgi:hypothetical protein